MAKYTVKHSCGHAQTHQLYGRHAERERKLEWLETTLCSDCFVTERDAQHAAESATAAELNAAAGLPSLTGSEKQIAWAESIRSKFLTELDGLVAKLSPAPELSEVAAGEIRDAIVLLANEPRQQSEARWWIDNRNRSAKLWFGEQASSRIAALAPTAVAELDAREVICD